jgi:hypothetical protein
VTGLALILILGAMILVLGVRLLVQWGEKHRTPTVSVDDYSRACASLDCVSAEMAAIKRIFASEDLDFISRVGTSEVERFFLKERKALAIHWLRTIQKRMASLMDLHVRLASYAYEGDRGLQLRLGADYLCFIFVSHLLLILLWLRGPFETVEIVGYMLRVSESLSSVFALRLEQTGRDLKNQLA